MLPYARAIELIRDVYDLSVLPGTPVSWVGEARAAPLLNADESELHIAANESLTWYGVHAKRGMKAAEAHGILPKRAGVLVHDCWAPYWQLDNSIHALCHAHLLCELGCVKEITGQQWPQSMMDLLLNANRLCEAARQKQRVLGAADVAALRALYDALVQEGERLHPERTHQSGKRGRVKQSIAFNLLRRFRQNVNAILRFISDPAVPFTNNLGDRTVRMPKVKQKISDCFCSLVGADHFCVICSCKTEAQQVGRTAPGICWRSDHANCLAAEQSTVTFNTMPDPKRKLTAAQKSEKAKYMTVFINGKQKRVRRPVLIDGLYPDGFYLRNADPITLHQDGLWECMVEAGQGDIAFADANDADCFGNSG